MNQQAHSTVTLINIFEVAAEQAEAFIAQWRERAVLMSKKPGFLDSLLHRALSSDVRFQFVNVAHWETPEAMQAATADPEFQKRIGVAVSDRHMPIASNAALYRVVVEILKA
jgi:heme oxygenase (mycobilin-producing)